MRMYLVFDFTYSYSVDVDGEEIALYTTNSVDEFKILVKPWLL